MKMHFVTAILVAILISGCTPTDEATTESDIKLGGVETGTEQISTPPLGERPPTIKPLASPTITNKKTTSDESLPDKMIVRTNNGTIVIDLYKVAAPNTIENFVSKAANDFYNGLTFHRIEDWVIQGGDPEGTGSGGGTIPTELSSIPFKEGSAGVARGTNINLSNDSQFFICIKECNWLNGEYTIFGQVSEGLEVAKSMKKGDTIASVTFE